MSGLAGWFGPDDGGAPAFTVDAMASRFAWGGKAERAAMLDARFGLVVLGPPGTVAIERDGDLVVALQGHPFLREGRRSGAGEVARVLLEAFRREGTACVNGIIGDFAMAMIDTRRSTIAIAVDRMGVRNVAWQQRGETLLFGPTNDVVNAHPVARREIDPQALYDYVYFHMVPGPRTVHRDVHRLQAGCLLEFDGHASKSSPYWAMQFDERSNETVDALRGPFRDALLSAVAQAAGQSASGTFLSGGTDSTTVTGMLCEVSGRPASTWSIGFAADGYDEMAYARIAAAHFHTEHHEHYVTPADVVAAIPVVAAAFDQPFGNASAVPTFCCARLARSAGVERMLGGDGGDELFGGNARYATQQRLALYEKLPGSLRRGLIEPLLLGMPGATSLPLVRKLRSYVAQARIPMPARYDSYNLLERLGPDAVFEPAFLATVDRAGPLAHVEAVWAGAQAQSLINRMLALDLKLTLADNDLPKVTRSCEVAGVDVAFPLLDDGVVAFAASLPPRFKLRGTTLRWFFKRALDDFLPPAVLVKQKHGFGLPAGVWMRDYAPLRELAREALSSLAKRGIVRRALIDDLVDRRLAEHPAYFGTLAWILMMLELWFTTRSD